jgi:chemotaxis protein MotA
MDFATFIGLFLALGISAGAIIFSQGIQGLLIFASLEAILVVLGGTFAAILVSFPFQEVWIALTTGLSKAIFHSKDTTVETARTVIDFAREIKTKGFTGMDRDVELVPNDFLRRGLQMAIDGADEAFIQYTMGAEIDLIKERQKVSQRVFTSMGTFAPAFGIIGTVLGMILMLNSIDNVDEVPKHMATALSAAFIGMSLGYMVFLPIVEKLKRRSEIEIIEKEMIMSGVVLIHRSVTPRLVEDCMEAYLTEANRAEMKNAVGRRGR